MSHRISRVNKLTIFACYVLIFFGSFSKTFFFLEIYFLNLKLFHKTNLKMTKRRMLIDKCTKNVLQLLEMSNNKEKEKNVYWCEVG